MPDTLGRLPRSPALERFAVRSEDGGIFIGYERKCAKEEKKENRRGSLSEM